MHLHCNSMPGSWLQQGHTNEAVCSSAGHSGQHVTAQLVAAAEALVDAVHGVACEHSTQEAADDAAEGMWELLKAQADSD